MTVSQELYYAILAMDAYNRFQRPNDPVGLSVSGNEVGNAVRRTDQLPDGAGAESGPRVVHFASLNAPYARPMAAYESARTFLHPVFTAPARC